MNFKLTVQSNKAKSSGQPVVLDYYINVYTKWIKEGLKKVEIFQSRLLSRNKKLQANLYELRISSLVEIRIFYTMHQEKYILLHGFKKKSQKTPTKELRVAVDRLKELI